MADRSPKSDGNISKDIHSIEIGERYLVLKSNDSWCE